MRRERTLLLPLISILFIFPILSSAQQLWTGVIEPSRAVDWSNAGVSGGIPARTTICQSVSLSAGSGAAAANTAAIQNAISTCSGTDETVSLPSGTYYVNGIGFGSANNVTVRGQGANSTFLVFSGTASCNLPSDVCFNGPNNSVGAEQNVCDWTAGYSTETTTITVANCGSTSPAKGSLSNMHVGTILMLDQVDEATDTGQIWNCAANTGANNCANTTQAGYDRTDGPSVSGISTRSQVQTVVVTGISGSNITISPGLYMPNWRSGQHPQIWYANSVGPTGDGIEDVSLDNSSEAASYIVAFFNVANDWASGIRGLYGGRDHVVMQYSYGITVQHSYFYQSQSHNTVSYTIEQIDSGGDLVQNNICQQVTDSCPNTGGPSEGNVAAYNFAVDQVYNSSGWFQSSLYQHASGDAFGLWEGNIGTGYTSDDVHGTHHFETLFRNHLLGNAAAGCGGAGDNTCTNETFSVNAFAGSRYINIVGNVLGDPGYHTGYQCVGGSSPCSDTYYNVYEFGATGNGGGVDSGITGFCLQPSCTTHGSYDPQTLSYSFRWGNYDVVTAGARFCGNSSDSSWGSMCSGTSEVPTSISAYSNAVPTFGDTSAGQSTMRPSFYSAAQPSWWPSGKPWPAIGPDVTGGDLGMYTSGSYKTALCTVGQSAGGASCSPEWGGHANSNPAMDCYLTVMGGPPDGSGGALSFNRASCYANGVSSDPPPAAPTGLSAVVQ
jgi:hypothetical protein